MAFLFLVQFWAISALILNCLAHYCQIIIMKEARPCVEVGVSLVVSSHGFLLQETQETGDRRQETGPVTLGTGESWPAGTIVGRGLHIPPAASANQRPARGHVTRLHQ